MTWLAAGLLLITVALGLECGLGLRRLARLEALPPRDPAGAPPVSIVVAARDEARMIDPALRSLLAQRYPALEVVVVDDRSTDGTGAILDRLAGEDPRLTVVHVTALPEGWLGKNHALWTGASRARGEWLLFTDADVMLHPETLSRAIRYAEAQRLDHLALTPDLHMPGIFLSAFAAGFVYYFCLFTKPWKARDPQSWFFIGVGAFNLVRHEAYQRAGTHRRIALRPDDDLKLGKILKRAGFRQDLVRGRGMASVEWYRTTRELVHGMEKNAFSGVDYNVLISVGGGLLQLVTATLPIVGILLATGAARLCFAAQIAANLVIFGASAREVRVSTALALLYPAVAVFFVFIVWRTMVLNLVQGGITWRGTFYPLAALKANKV